MAITYSPANVTRLAEVNKIAENGRCLGFIVPGYSEKHQRRTEVLYAVKDDVILCWYGFSTPDFNPSGRVWNRVDSVPECAEFCGSYKMPTQVRA